MSITSFYFLCLFALALLLYYLVPKKVQWPLLLLLSIGYFLTSAEVRDSHAWYLILYPMAAVGAVWGAAILIDRTKEQKKKLNDYFEKITGSTFDELLAKAKSDSKKDSSNNNAKIAELKAQLKVYSLNYRMHSQI